MTTTQQIITIAVVVLGTMTTRFLPFIIFSADSAPEFVRFLGRVLPNAVIGLLVIYSLKDSIGGVNHCIPELIALAFIFILHKWKKNTLLSIAGGTILYMFLVQIVTLVAGKTSFAGVCMADPAAWLAALVPLLPYYFYIMRKWKNSDLLNWQN